jgi:hypothetical protein
MGETKRPFANVHAIVQGAHIAGAAIVRGAVRAAAAVRRALRRLHRSDEGSADSFTLATAHQDLATGHVLLDLIREVKPAFNPRAWWP